MTAAEIEQRYLAIRKSKTSPYTSLLVSSNCIPELYISLDLTGKRYVILQVPDKVKVDCSSTVLENLSIEWHEDTRFVLIGLQNNYFSDLFNELTLSIYNKIYQEQNPVLYTAELIKTFHKWAEFFSDSLNPGLTDAEVKGLLGELIVMEYFLNSASGRSETNEILNGWQGPYERAHDFIFPSLNLEVKTKDQEATAVKISSEFQLQPISGKALQLAIVDVKTTLPTEGLNLRKVVARVKELVVDNDGDMTIFLKALVKARLHGSDQYKYDHLTWSTLNIHFFDCGLQSDFPRIIRSELPEGITNVTYRLTVSDLQNFLIKKINL